MVCIFDSIRSCLRSLGLACLLAFLTAGGAWAYDLAIELPAEIEARDGAFLLGEYAAIEGDPDLVSSVAVAEIVPRGDSFGRDDVIQALGSTAAAGKSVALRMPETVRILPEHSVAAGLRTMTAWQWRIDVDGIPPRETRTGSYESISLPPRVQPGARSLAVKLLDGKGRASNKQIKVRWYQPIVYSLQSIERNAPIDLADIRVRVDTIGMTGTPLWSTEQLQNVTARADIPAGRAIGTGDVEETVVVKSGSRVTMVARVNGLGVEVNGVALQRGAIGDVIKVKNLSSKKVLTGKIVDVGRVEID